MDALQIHSTVALPLLSDNNNASVETRLRRQMQSDALHPLREDADDTEVLSADPEFATDVLEEVAQFVRLQVRLRRSLRSLCLIQRYTGTGSPGISPFVSARQVLLLFLVWHAVPESG